MPIPVFVYGSLRKGMGNHSFMKHSTYWGQWCTVKEYYMIGFKCGAFPYVCKSPVFEGPPTKIEGELYFVDEKTLHSLDCLEGIPIHYQRVLIEIESEDGRYEAFIYMLEDEDLIEMMRMEKEKFERVEGDWVKHSKLRNA